MTLTDTELPYNYHSADIDTAGDYTIVLATTAGCDSTILLHVEVNHIGIQRATSSLRLTLHPNPTKGLVTVECEDEVLHVEVYDASGRKVATVEGCKDIRLNHLPDGVYTFRIVTTKDITVRRVVKR